MSWEDAILQAIGNEINKIHTSIPAVVSKYDKTGPTVEVKPLIKKVYLEGKVVSLPTIVSVPVVFPRTTNFRLSFPISEGDGVLLVFSERSLEGWLKNCC